MTWNTLFTPFERRATSRRFILSFLICLLLALAACGGNGTETTGEGTEVVAPTLAATEPAEAAPTDAPATEAPPTEVPPTEAVPTEAPTEAAEPTAETASAGNLPEGDCANEFFPVVEGRSLRYGNTVPDLGASEYTQTFSDVTDSSFTVTMDLGEGDALVQSWTCSGEGLLSPEFTQLPGGVEGMTIEYVEAEGVSVPPADQMQPGGEWTTHYVVNATLPDTGAGAMTMTETIDLVNTVTAVEAVSVPAGDYPDAVRVETTGTIGIVMTLGDQTQPATDVAMNFTTWYVEGVGMVRQEMEGMLDSGAIVTELIAVEE
ncbi:hypothetical protein [Promineifilum sp.]|uniref:TapB family protein n=1 Tax=Promineifilum sp. TaxID=2664178 RepID=UPI0035AE9EF1